MPRGWERDPDDGGVSGGGVIAGLYGQPHGEVEEHAREARVDARFYATDAGPDFVVSIHAPAWGATLDLSDVISTIISFNPRARVGRDNQPAPAWARPTRFNPRARVGRDEAARKKKDAIAEFQSTRPRGARLHSRPCFRALWIRFNPRARVGRDLGLIVLDYVQKVFQSTRPRGARPAVPGAFRHHESVSIHAPAWGATQWNKGKQEEFIVSIHAPAWGATDARSTPRSPVSSFNPRARVGRDRTRKTRSALWRLFQSTRPRGARREAGVPVLHPSGFNPRARVGRDPDGYSGK